MKTIIAIFAAFLSIIPAFAQSPKIEDVFINWGGPGALHKTTKFPVDLLENITAIKDEDGKLIPLYYKMRVRLHNNENAKEESYRLVFYLAKDSTDVVASSWKNGVTSIKMKLWMEIYVPNEVNIEEVLTDDYMAILSTKGEDTKENKKLFKKEVSVLMDRYHLCAMRFTVYKSDGTDSAPGVNLSTMQDDD